MKLINLVSYVQPQTISLFHNQLQSYFLQRFIIFMKITLANKKRIQTPSIAELSEQISQMIKQIEEYESNVRRSSDSFPIYIECGTTYVQVSRKLLSGIRVLKITRNAIYHGKGNLKLYKQLIDIYLKQFSDENFWQKNKYQQVGAILQIQNMLNIFIEFFSQILQFQPDITVLPQYLFPEVWKNIKINSLGNPQKITKQQKLLKKAMYITSASMLSQQKIQNSFLKTLTFGLAYPTYLIKYQLAKLKTATLYRNPTVEQVKAIWNIPQDTTIKFFQNIFYEKIQFKQHLYFPQHCPQQVRQLPNIYQKQPTSIHVVLINHNTLRQKQNFNGKFKQQLNIQDRQIDTIMLYFHGGGFIALSCQTMECYTRKWANQLKIPIFAVDYRKPPSYRFPVALQDCFNIYQFITKYIQFYYNINPKKIILAGDSAGGNLACSLTGLTLKFKLPQIHGLFLAYPAVDLRKRFSPSFINAFQESILHPNLLLMCMREYLGNIEQNQHNPLASPILLTQQYCNGKINNKKFPSNWPKTKIIVGRKDPLFDSSLCLMERMIESGVDCECEVYENFSHGFLNYAFVHKQIGEIINQSIQSLKLIIE